MSDMTSIGHRDLLLEIAGFIKLLTIAPVGVTVKAQAEDLPEKIGKVLAS